MSGLIFPEVTFDECALCAESSDLLNSHIIPKFVIKWLRDSSATGRIRFAEAPNVRVQDGLKVRMLCKDCEKLFSSWEKKFVESCFTPLNDGRIRRFTYGPWMLKFATSVSWRVLSVFSASTELSDYPPDLLTAVDDALIEWRQFLTGRLPHPGRHEQHMFLVDLLEESTIEDTPPNISRYFTRTIDCDVPQNGDSVFTYTKLGKFVLCGFVTMQYPRRWKGTKLNANRGKFGIQDIELPSDIGEYMFDRAKLAGTAAASISDRQRQKMQESYENDLDRAAKSETFRAMQNDVSLFGNKAFEVTQPNIIADTDKID